MIKQKEYRIDIQNLKNKEFKYNYQEDYYTYIFPVYKYKKKSLLFCKIYIYSDGIVKYNVEDNNGNTYANYYNREYGANELLTIIDSTIKKEFAKLGIKQKKVGVKNSKLHDEI